jgi:hypothetical protein
MAISSESCKFFSPVNNTLSYTSRYKYATEVNGDNTTKGYDSDIADPQIIYGAIVNSQWTNNVLNRPVIPARRDTLMVERGWTYVIAIQATNSGVWVSHLIRLTPKVLLI